MSKAFDDRAIGLVIKLNLAKANEVLSVRPLCGGVASDIGVVETSSGDFCVKFALEQLRVAQEWHVPVSRNIAEYDWLSFAGSVLPGAVPRLFGRDDQAGGFAMEMIAGPDVVLWKTALLGGQTLGQEAERVADALGRIHRASTAQGFDRKPFNNRDLFRAIRIEPYLSHVAIRHPSVAARLNHLAEGLFAAATTLVHGDVSPKNILIRKTGPVFLDAECATMGDPAFDLAFCINHLVLKAVHVDARILSSIAAFWAAYDTHVDWEDSSAVQARSTALVPALMLARIDGKSPVEYLTEKSRVLVREVALRLLSRDHTDLSALVQDIAKQISVSEEGIK